MDRGRATRSRRGTVSRRSTAQRRGIAIGVTVATVAGLAAVTWPALAGEDPPRPEPANPSRQLVDALRRDLSLTEAQARTRLDRERWARTTTRQLRAELGAGYGGAWFTADGNRLMVAVTDQGTAARVRAAGAEPKLVTRNARQLDTVKASLDRIAEEATPDVAGWYVDVSNNRVVVRAQPGTEADVRRFVRASGAPADAVEVVASAEAPVPLIDVRGGDPYLIDGRARCSIGFSVVGGFVTAGHCGAEGATTSSPDGVAQGVVSASSFPGDDWGVVQTNDDWVPQPVVNDFDGGTIAVAGGQEAPVGSSICRFGSTTGARCGVVEALNATVVYPEGTVTGLTRTDVCAEPGDSGGSWMSGDQAQGVTSGGSGDCTVGGTTFFQPLTEILEVNQLTLVTTADGATPPAEPPAGTEPPAATEPPATEPPAGEDPPAAEAPPGSECVGHRALKAATLGAGRRQVQPAGRYFRAGHGRQTGCLDGPDGANFDLVLQRWSRGGWRTVAVSAGPTADERISFTGSAGFYRYRVEARRGSGDYTLGFSVR
ncbi:alpha-lytic protease prodomain-containing protein [Micromonospora sp. WMMD1102]|uniref:S1 family peptidase n=1 Tax=Micromonospora sp. WMMD1102 TaxID=3016105 RepID=UPI0024151D74|nr:alpha-lytic protease prodomain-containing protein [Micromonospora sp. WMMD1102]MDG4785721.1 alpha-lytic protease prodomain-containing protein [Micromonospora sp. WMMD1102]